MLPPDLRSGLGSPLFEGHEERAPQVDGEKHSGLLSRPGNTEVHGGNMVDLGRNFQQTNLSYALPLQRIGYLRVKRPIWFGQCMDQIGSGRSQLVVDSPKGGNDAFPAFSGATPRD